LKWKISILVPPANLCTGTWFEKAEVPEREEEEQLAAHCAAAWIHETLGISAYPELTGVEEFFSFLGFPRRG